LHGSHPPWHEAGEPISGGKVRSLGLTASKRRRALKTSFLTRFPARGVDPIRDREVHALAFLARRAGLPRSRVVIDILY